MRRFALHVFVAVWCFFVGGVAAAQDVRVSGASAGAKIKVTVEPERKGLLARISERRAAAKQPVIVMATQAPTVAAPAFLPTIVPAVMPAAPVAPAPRPRVVIE